MDILLNQQAVRIPCIAFGLGIAFAPALGIQSWTKAIMLFMNVGKIKIFIISIFTFLLYVDSYFIAFILGGRLLLPHTYRWGAWGSSC